MKIIRSMESYDHLFRIWQKNANGEPINAVKTEILIKGRSHAPKNITIVEDDSDWEELQDFPQVAELLKRMVFQVLPDVPTTFYDSQELMAQNRGKLLDKQKELETTQAIVTDKDREIEVLKNKLRDNGITV